MEDNLRDGWRGEAGRILRLAWPIMLTSLNWTLMHLIDVAVVGHYLDALEAEHGLEPGQIRVMAIVTETPSAMLRMGEIAKQAHPRISHVAWAARI